MIDKNMIKAASWLSDSQKKRLTALYNATAFKDIEDQAFDMLKFSMPGAARMSPCDYKNMVVDLMSGVQFNEMGEAQAQEYRSKLENLYLFFDVLDCDSFHTFCDIKEAYNYADENDSHEPAIDKLYREHVAKVQNELMALQSI